jgi:hypothetical protein
MMTTLCRTIGFAIATLSLAMAAAAAPAPTYTPAQARLLAIRAAQVDGYQRLAELILGAHALPQKTVGDVIGRGTDGEIALRLFLRSARTIGDPRVYSDGAAEVDIEIPFDGVVQKLTELCRAAGTAAPALADLRAQAVDGQLRVEGRGRPAQDLPPEVVQKVEGARLDEFIEIYPTGWERVTAEGRVEAVRRARISVYAALNELVRALRVGQAYTVGDMVRGSISGEAQLEALIRGLPVAGAPRLMPDCVAEVSVSVDVRDLIRVLREIRALTPSETRWTDEQIEQLSAQLKTDRLTATGRGMPAPQQVRPEEALSEAAGVPLPDWAARVLEGRGVAKRPIDVEDDAEARLLTARSAKAMAVVNLERQVEAVKLDDGGTVRERMAKDEVFRRDVAALLASAKIVKYEPTADGKQWEAVLRLPLQRLWGFARPRQ